MDATNFRTLGPEGDRLDALAAMLGAAASMALAVGRRLIGHGGGRHVIRQGRALGRLANALADGFDRGGGNLDEGTVNRISAALAAAGRAEKRGLRHDRLLTLPADWTGPLRMTAPDLALVGVVRLRQALEKYALAGGDPKRVAQLQAIRQLERAVRGSGRDADAGKIESGEALRAVVARFAAAEGAIGEDIPALLGGEPAAPGSTILTRGYGMAATA